MIRCGTGKKDVAVVDRKDKVGRDCNKVLRNGK